MTIKANTDQRYQICMIKHTNYTWNNFMVITYIFIMQLNTKFNNTTNVIIQQMWNKKGNI